MTQVVYAVALNRFSVDPPEGAHCPAVERFCERIEQSDRGGLFTVAAIKSNNARLSENLDPAHHGVTNAGKVHKALFSARIFGEALTGTRVRQATIPG